MFIKNADLRSMTVMIHLFSWNIVVEYRLAVENTCGVGNRNQKTL